MAYIGASPSNGVRRKHTYTATASQTTFSGAGAEGAVLSYRDSNYVDVYVNGVKLGDADYTATSGTSIVLGVGAAVNDIVEIMAYDVFSVADTVSKADGGTFDGNVSFAGTLAVTGETTLSANLNLGDNDKAIFGAGDDFSISHSSVNGNLIEMTASPLELHQSGTNSVLQLHNDASIHNVVLQVYKENTLHGTISTDTNKLKIDGVGSLELSDDGSTKLATTSSGIDVTGTVSADQVTLDGTGTSNFTSTATSPVQINGTSIPTLTVRNSTTPVELQMRATTGEGLVRTSTNHPLTFAVNASEKMRIDSSGNLLVGTTNANPAESNVAGIGLLAGNAISVTDDGGAPIQLNRKTSDGSIAIFRKDGSAVGNIGVTASDQFYIARSTGNHGIKFKNSATMPSSSAGADADNAQDLGSSSVRWKDLYLSGKAQTSLINTGSSTGTLTLYGGSTNQGGKIVLDGGNNNGDIVLHTGQYTATPPERMRIDSSGRVGIGVVPNVSPGASRQGLQISNGSNGALISLSNASSESNNPRIFSNSADLGFATGVSGSGVLQFYTADVERIRIASSGNVGIGGAPNNWGGMNRTLELIGSSDVQLAIHANSDSLSNEGRIGEVAFLAGTTNTLPNVATIVGRVAGTDEAKGFLTFHCRDTDTAGLPQERMRITTQGAMTMGTTTSQTAVSGITLKNDVQSGYPTLLFLQNQPGTGGTMGADIHMGYASDYGSILRFYGNPFSKRQGGFEFRRVTGSGTSDLSMRINDDGNVGIGDSSNIARLMVESNFTSYTGINVKNNHSVASGVFINFTNSSGTQAGSISHNGSTTVAYNTSSDHRLKENVTADWDATTRLKQLNPVRFNFIADADTTVDGFLAHEVQSVVPEAITGTHNEVDADGNPKYQGIDQSKLVPLLVKTIQELEARIEALENA